MKQLVNTYRLDGGMRRRDYSNLQDYLKKKYGGDQYSVTEHNDALTDQHVFKIWQELDDINLYPNRRKGD